MEALCGGFSARSFPTTGGPVPGTDSNTKTNIRASVGFRRKACFRRESGLTSGVSNWDYFKERDHLDYYYNCSSGVAGGVRRGERCGNMKMMISCGKGGDCKVEEKKKEKEEKKQKKQKKMMMKMEKKLKKMVQNQIVQADNLPISSEIDDPINPFPDESKVSKMISDAAEKLLEQLQQIRAEDMTSESSSSSSSESSDSDSDCGTGVVTDMRTQRNCCNTIAHEPKSQEATPFAAESLVTSPAEAAALVSSQILENVNAIVAEGNLEQQVECISGTSVVISPPVAVSAGFLPAPTKKVEVCIGGKCKKSGSMALLGEFQRVLGTTEYAAVTGCKCMGKCRDGPNVRISDDLHTNSLCIGVGLTDVSTIVANYVAPNPEYGLNYA